MTTFTSTSTSESIYSSSLKLHKVTATHELGLNEGASGHTSSTSCPNNDCLMSSPERTRLWTQDHHNWTEAMEKVRDICSPGGRSASADREENITRPYDYLAAQPGKDIRKQLLAACNFWLHIDDTSLATIGRTVSMLHNASLLIDDIQDGSRLRRGRPAAHTVYGIALTINSANHAYFLAQKELLGLGEVSGAMINIFNEELVNLHRGQGMDIFWRETATTPTEDEYLLMISNKTGGLFRLGIRLMQAVSTSQMDLVPLANLLGLMFQIQDDYSNLTSQPMAMAKGYCDDLEEGKFSFPVIHAIWNDPSQSGWMLDSLRKRPSDESSKRQAVEYMTSVTRSMEYTTSTLEALMDQLKASLAELGRNVAFEDILGRIQA
ncbi:MAG: hypothetical protein L6R36_008005 [Xanthoria steineri]|nr:MAG: hypothetical protein L6R36_008005 [Xanthoria steineri]